MGGECCLRSGAELASLPRTVVGYVVGVLRALWSAQDGAFNMVLVGPVVPGTLQFREQQRRAA
ncbi:MAG: hypothetical protein QOH63_1485 [Acidobacteriota bacterium]|jgi:hypothetical protein|nr:hypothetical protein [Acidobacteriota bacterium]